MSQAGIDGPVISKASARSPRYAPLVLVLAFVCAGIVLDRFFPLRAETWWCAALAASCIWLALSLTALPRSASVVQCLFWAALGAAWHHAWWQVYPNDEIARRLGPEPVGAVVEATALYAPRLVPAPPKNVLMAVQVEERSRFEVQITAVRNGLSWQRASGRALVMVQGRLEGIQAGDRLRIVGALAGSRRPMNPGDLDFAAFARAERRMAFLSASFPESVTLLSRGSPWNWRRWLDGIRQGGNRALWRHISPHRAPLAAALLLGAREQLDAERTEAFLLTNTIHILAISGMHVAILAGSLFYGMRLGFLPRRTALAAVAAATVLYTLLTDAPPSAVRAMIMVLLVCLAMFAGRPASSFNCWAAGGLVVLAFNPADLFRAGTQLSFLAVGAMAWTFQCWAARPRPDPLTRLIRQTRPWPVRALRWAGQITGRAFLVTTIIWLATAPLVAGRFHLASPSAVVLSTVLIPVISVALMSGFATMLFGVVLPPVADLCGVLCERSLAWIEQAINLTSRLPASHIWISGPNDAWLAAFYLGLAIVLMVPLLRGAHYLQLGGVWLALVLALRGGAVREADGLQCTFICVGHGTSVLLRTAEGHTILYDAGRLGSPSAAARSIAGVLWSEDVLRLDAIIVSHADIDHYNAVPALLQRFPVGAIYVSPFMFRDEIEPLKVLRAEIDRCGVPVRLLCAGDRLTFGSALQLQVLHPPEKGVAGSDNAHSLVMAVEHAGRRVVLPGDLESPGTEALLAQPAWDCDVLLAPHHGSLRSNPPGFPAWCLPEWVVISGGHSSGSAEQVASAYRTAGAGVFHTAHAGAVRLRLSPASVQAECWNGNRWQPFP